MPNFTTVAAAHSYCTTHFPSTPWWKVTLWGDLALMLAGYIVGKFGLETVWSWIKSIYSWIRNKVRAQSATVTPQAQTVTSVAGTTAPAAA